MEYKTHFYSVCSLILVYSYWPWKFTDVFHQPCDHYKPLEREIKYPFKTWAECRSSVEFGEKHSSWTNTKISLVEEINLRGYNATTHSIQSDDGYISTIYRISGCLKSPQRMGKTSVLLFHGGFGGSASWIIQPGSRNLAFLLADSGYEVWLASIRGTSPSQNHTKLNSQTDLEYWEFTFEDIGTRDLPRFVDLILDETKTDKLYFICHSAGCISYTIGLIEKPELNAKFKAGFFLAPGNFVGSSYNPLLHIWASMVGSPIEPIAFKMLKGRAEGKPGELATALGLTPENICGWKFLRCGICDRVFFALYGNDALQLNYSNFPNILTKLQDTMAIKLLIHGMKNYKNCSFRKYDYGPETNLLKYGTTQPPHYNMDRVAVPTYLFYGESDNMVTPTDVAKLRDAMPTKYMRGFHAIEWPAFNHVDFLIANDADVLLYNKIMKYINELESKN